MTYKIFEHEKAKKFFKKNKNNKKLLLRINKEYIKILKNPFDSSYKELNSIKSLNVIEHVLEILE